MFGTFREVIRVCDVGEVNERFAPVLEKPVTLTPNGKKYELREVGAPEQPEHPATLVTEQDYANAPVGTIVAAPGFHAWTKSYGDSFPWSQGGTWCSNSDMADTERQVLRWGWGK